MESLFNCVKTFCLTQGLEKTYWIAYSGGLDSHVLLHLCAELRKQVPVTLKAIYINHGLSPHANTWANRCETVCHELNVEFFSTSINVVVDQGDSLEALARQLRYHAIAQCMQPNDVLLTAHHQDDQAETVLLQLMRGSGPKGLSAMPILKPFAEGWHGRPLLECSRQDLEKYANAHSLQWIDDESNLNINFNRNFIRHEVLPLLKKRWPAATTNLTRVATQCADAENFMQASVDQYLALAIKENGLSVPILLNFSSVVQRHILRRWLAQLKFSLPSTVKMQQIQQSLLLAASDKLPHVSWGNVELRRYQNIIYAMKKLTMHDSTQCFNWNLQQPLAVPQLGELCTELVKGQGLKQNISQVTVRFRQGGEVCRLPGRDFHHELKYLFQQWGVPPWQRGRIPLLFVGEQLVAVLGFYIHPDFLAGTDELGRVASLVS